jgi:hypothetical protein
MSDHEIIIQLLKRLERMLSQQTLLHKDVLNSRETALYMGRSVCSVYRLRRKNNLVGYRPNNGRLYFKRQDVYNWMLSIAQESISGPQREEEKLSILNQERG